MLQDLKEPYAFISSSQKDKDLVERISSVLRSQGIPTWTDVENISAGTSWREGIKRGLLQATFLLYVASKNSVKSNWLEAEISTFMQGGGRVIPLIIDDEGKELLPKRLKEIQGVDFRSGEHVGIRQLVAGLNSLRISSPIAAPETRSKGYVFVSYADEDFKFVEELKVFLRNKGYAYWDYRESPRNYQVDFTIELEGTIKEAAAILSIISPYWKDSTTARQEMHFSKQVGTPVFLILLKDPGPTLLIAGMNFIDFSRNCEGGFSKLDYEMRRNGL